MTGTATQTEGKLDSSRDGRRADRWMRDLVTAHAATLQRIAAAQVGPGMADDVVAESFATAWRDQASYDPSLGSERAWLVGIVMNRCRSMGRARRRWERQQHDILVRSEWPTSPDFASLSDDRVDATSRRLTVMDAMRDLPEMQRTVMVLVVLGELTPAEVATALDMPPGTVRNHLFRARRALATALGLEEPS